MCVVGHHHIAIQQVPHSVEMPQGIFQDFTEPGLSQKALPITTIKPILSPIYKPGLVLSESLPFPRLRMVMHPDFQLLLPLGQYVNRQRISQPEGDEVGCTLLSPMRQVPLLHTDRTGPVQRDKDVSSRERGRMKSCQPHRLETCATVFHAKLSRQCRNLPATLAGDGAPMPLRAARAASILSTAKTSSPKASLNWR